jgi:hypothetical protein
MRLFKRPVPLIRVTLPKPYPLGIIFEDIGVRPMSLRSVSFVCRVCAKITSWLTVPLRRSNTSTFLSRSLLLAKADGV